MAVVWFIYSQKKHMQLIQPTSETCQRREIGEHLPQMI